MGGASHSTQPRAGPAAFPPLLEALRRLPTGAETLRSCRCCVWSVAVGRRVCSVTGPPTCTRTHCTGSGLVGRLYTHSSHDLPPTDGSPFPMAVDGPLCSPRSNTPRTSLQYSDPSAPDGGREYGTTIGPVNGKRERTLDVPTLRGCTSLVGQRVKRGGLEHAPVLARPPAARGLVGQPPRTSDRRCAGRGWRRLLRGGPLLEWLREGGASDGGRLWVAACAADAPGQWRPRRRQQWRHIHATVGGAPHPGLPGRLPVQLARLRARHLPRRDRARRTSARRQWNWPLSGATCGAAWSGLRKADTALMARHADAVLHWLVL